MNLYEKKTGFTLAEVLITLGIVGIVAAITIPNLIVNNKARVLRSKFLKSYSTLSQMMKLIENDDVILDTTLSKNLIKYLPGATFKNSTAGTGNVNSDDPFFYWGNEAYKTYSGKVNASKNVFDDGQYALQDGSLLLLEWDEAHFPVGTRNWISVDLNGYNNGPNRWGVDLFTFQIVDGRMVAMGDEGTSFTDLSKYCDKNSNDIHNGIACTHLAKTDSEYFKKAVRLK